MPSTLVPFDRNKLKILQTRLNPQPLVKRLPPNAKVLYKHFHRCLEKSESQIAREANNPDTALPKPYWDPVLRNSKHVRQRFLVDLFNLGLLGLGRSIKSRVGIFLVKKKDPKFIRMIIDARLTNRLHHSPPVTRLASSACYRDLDLSSEGACSPVGHSSADDGTGYGQEADVADCFYNYSIE